MIQATSLYSFSLYLFDHTITLLTGVQLGVQLSLDFNPCWNFCFKHLVLGTNGIHSKIR